jgi:WD40 repeat protein
VDAEDAAFQLAQKLEDKTCLIVLDDVWDPAYLRPFLRGGGGCARVITTRQFEVARDTARVKVDEMRPSKAVEMLTAELKPPPTVWAPFQALAERLGEWPLLLKLAAGALRERLQRGDTLDGALAYVSHALDKRGLTAFDKDEPIDRHQAVRSTLGISLDLLSKDQRQRCAELAIFPEDARIPLSAVQALWGLDAFDTEELVQRLADVSLVELDLRADAVSLHDVIRSFLRRGLSDERSLHDRLLNAWGDPRSARNEYALCWLAHHLTEAGRQEELVQLLLDLDWIQAKLATKSVNALIDDYDYLPEDHALRVVQGALKLSAHVLAKDPAQLRSQLYGRLGEGSESGVNMLLERIRRSGGRPWLRPLPGALVSAGGPLVRILSGHFGVVTAVAVTPDGEHAVSASWDKTLKVWDLASGEEQFTLTGHSDWVTAVAVTPDGKQAVSASRDSTLKVWDLASGEEKLALAGHSDRVTAVAVTPDGKRAVSASGDKTLKLWDLATGDERLTLTGHAAWVTAVAVTPDGRRAISASGDATLRVWDLASGEAELTLVGHSGSATSVAVSPDGRRAVSASADGTLRVWDLSSGEEKLVLAGHSGLVTAVVVLPGGGRAVSASADKTLKVWDLGNARETLSLAGHLGEVTALAAAPDGRPAVSASEDATLRVWDLAGEKKESSLPGHSGWVTSVAVTPDGKGAVSASRDTTLRVWDVASGKEKLTLSARSHELADVAISADGNRAVSVSWDDVLKVWDLATGDVIAAFTADDRLAACGIGPDGVSIVAGGAAGRLHFLCLDGVVPTG